MKDQKKTAKQIQEHMDKKMASAGAGQILKSDQELKDYLAKKKKDQSAAALQSISSK